MKYPILSAPRAPDCGPPGRKARTTVRPPAKPKRERHRPDPLVKVTEQLRAWFEAEPWTTNRQLLERPQAAHPGVYPDGLLRTV